MKLTFESRIDQRLRSLHESGLHRRLRETSSPQGRLIQADGRPLINFSSNDYLGLANDARIIEAAKRASETAGAGAGASRLISGNHGVHTDLEKAIADLKQTQDALVFSTGYTAAVGTIPSLVGKDDIVVIDRLAHASLVDGARMSGAMLRVFRHNDPSDLERILTWAAPRQCLIVTESVFSMDGDLAPLGEIVELKNRFGAWLMVDEAHATGVLGDHGEGLVGSLGLSDQIEVQMGTLGKALGSAGGFIAGSSTLFDLLINSARSFIFSTAPVPAQAGAASAAIKLVSSPRGDELRSKLRENIANVGQQLLENGCLAHPPESPIVPVLIGDEREAVRMADALLESGFWVPAIRHPTVGRGKARLRISITARHTSEDITRLVETLRKVRS